MFTNIDDVKDVLLPNQMLKPDENVKILPDIPYSEHDVIIKILEESQETFFRGRDVFVQGVQEKKNPDYADYDILKWKCFRQFLKL